METVIAIGVLSVLLTGFLIVFTPAADGIRKAISSQDADRLASVLEHELTNRRSGTGTGFDKAFEWIRDSTGIITTADAGDPNKALLVYQYRGSTSSARTDGSPEPVANTEGSAGNEYTLVPMVRRKNDALFLEDLTAVEGPILLTKCVQLVNDPDAPGSLIPSVERGKIMNPKLDDGSSGNYNAGPFSSAADYPEAVIAFMAEFYPVPGKARGFFAGSAFNAFYQRSTKPVFTRSLGVRR